MYRYEHFEFTGTDAISLVVSAKTIVRVQSGRLWLTAQGKSEDIWLCAGDQWEATDATRLHLSAEPQATFALGCPVADRKLYQRRSAWLPLQKLASA